MAEALTTIITFLGGGVLGAGIQYVRAARSEREQRLSSYTNSQIDKLYGPLYFYTSQNEKLFELSRKILEAHSTYFDREWSQSPQTQKSVLEESTNTIALSNSYVEQVVRNNDEILTILRSNFGFADMDDVEIFTQFSIDVIRLKNEVEGEKMKGIPLNIYRIVGDISYSRPEFLRRVKDKFAAKQEQLKRLH